MNNANIGADRMANTTANDTLIDPDEQSPPFLVLGSAFHASVSVLSGHTHGEIGVVFVIVSVHTSSGSVGQSTTVTPSTPTQLV
jgi:hypothetical protein